MSSSLGFAGLSRARVTRARRGQIRLSTKCRNSTRANDQNDGPTISVPFRAILLLRKGISHTPSGGQAIDEATRSALLMAIARSKAWFDTMIKDPGTDIGTIAERENLAERHVRFLAPLAYLSPRIE
jgi:hypothetical protein